MFTFASAAVFRRSIGHLRLWRVGPLSDDLVYKSVGNWDAGLSYPSRPFILHYGLLVSFSLFFSLVASFHSHQDHLLSQLYPTCLLSLLATLFLSGLDLFPTTLGRRSRTLTRSRRFFLRHPLYLSSVTITCQRALLVYDAPPWLPWVAMTKSTSVCIPLNRTGSMLLTRPRLITTLCCPRPQKISVKVLR